MERLSGVLAAGAISRQVIENSSTASSNLTGLTGQVHEPSMGKYGRFPEFVGVLANSSRNARIRSTRAEDHIGCRVFCGRRFARLRSQQKPTIAASV